MLNEIKLKVPRLTKRIACAVEPEFETAVKAYAEQENVTVSQAMRYLAAIGLQVEFKKTKSGFKKS